MTTERKLLIALLVLVVILLILTIYQHWYLDRLDDWALRAQEWMERLTARPEIPDEAVPPAPPEIWP